MTMRDKAECIMRESIQRVMPGPAVTTALQNCKFSEGRLYLVAVGKAAWEMANSAVQCLDKKVCAGIVLTKYGHVQGSIKDVVCYEAGHPVPDENSLRGTQAILRMVTGLEERDTVLFLLSGGGSSLFEKPFIPLEELQEITAQLLACGASITEINTIRKHLSQVKGGRFAVMCKPAHVNSIILSDVIGDQIDMIASGPTCGDSAQMPLLLLRSTTSLFHHWHKRRFNLKPRLKYQMLQTQSLALFLSFVNTLKTFALRWGMM